MRGGGRGTRAVASYDEDATTMGVEAARVAPTSSGARPATARSINGRTLGLTHNLGGQPGRCVSFVSIVGRERGDPR
jgi:hypothetical protein